MCNYTTPLRPLAKGGDVLVGKCQPGATAPKSSGISLHPLAPARLWHQYSTGPHKAKLATRKLVRRGWRRYYPPSHLATPGIAMPAKRASPRDLEFPSVPLTRREIEMGETSDLAAASGGASPMLYVAAGRVADTRTPKSRRAPLYVSRVSVPDCVAVGFWARRAWAGSVRGTFADGRYYIPGNPNDPSALARSCNTWRKLRPGYAGKRHLASVKWPIGISVAPILATSPDGRTNRRPKYLAYIKVYSEFARPIS